MPPKGLITHRLRNTALEYENLTLQWKGVEGGYLWLFDECKVSLIEQSHSDILKHLVWLLVTHKTQ